MLWHLRLPSNEPVRNSYRSQTKEPEAGHEEGGDEHKEGEKHDHVAENQ